MWTKPMTGCFGGTVYTDPRAKGSRAASVGLTVNLQKFSKLVLQV